jgi:hypothetical protein
MRIRALEVTAGALLVAAGVLAGLTSAAAARASAAAGPGGGGQSERRTLQAPSAFANIADPAQRSAALFVEAGKVLLHPRCVNCHPAGDRPLQGDTGALHEPWVRRGPDGFGPPGLRCATCHPAANYDAVRMPGHPKWHLAPAEMAWEGRTLTQICEQIKDPARNGGHSLKEIVEHMANDSLVGWGWTPGLGRQPAPGTQVQFGALFKAWLETGAACPPAPGLRRDLAEAQRAKAGPS